MTKSNDIYDAIIIGAGVGGLVCASYLAKAGMKVLVIEKNAKAGGYCSSFRRKKYSFDVGVHYFAGCQDEGLLGKIFRDLELHNKLFLNRKDLTDRIITLDHAITINTNIDETIHNFKEEFPHQAKKLDSFFHFINTKDFWQLYAYTKSMTFKDLLNKYFNNDEELHSVFKIVLGNVGLPSSRVAALTAAIMYRNFILNGGYYPAGGMQSLPNALVDTFTHYGGRICYSKEVKKIKVKNKKVDGVLVDNGEFIKAKYVISNCDATHTFLKLIGKSKMDKKMIDKLNSLTFSTSAFIVYMGVEKNLKRAISTPAIWYCKERDIDKIYAEANDGKLNFANKFIFCSFPSFHDESLAPSGCESMHLMVLAPYKDELYWQKNKMKLASKLIRVAENFIPNLSNSITIKEIATPSTLHKYTLNRGGALYGWASIPSQNGQYRTWQSNGIQNLFTVGHWTLTPYGQGGINMVAQVGQGVAKSILRKSSSKMYISL